MISSINNPIFSIEKDGRQYLVYPVYFLRLIQPKQQNDIQICKVEEQEVKMEPIQQQKLIYYYPGQTKNYYKNVGNKFSDFILNNFDVKELKKDQQILKFINIKDHRYNKLHFIQLMQSKIARQLLKMYFGNFRWCTSVQEHARSDVEFYLGLNKNIFKKKPKFKHKQFKQHFPHQEV